MLPFKRILFPVDFSDRCFEAGAYAIAMAKHFEAELTLLHAVDATLFEYYGMNPVIATSAAYAEILREHRRQDLNSFLQDELFNLPVKRVVEHGDVAGIITEYARTNAIQLIMMPTHGYGPFRRFLIGSVTAKVLHDAECPVWTGVHLKGEMAPKAPCYRKVLCAVDGTTESISLLRSAAQFAEEFGAVLQLVHAIPGSEATAVRLDTAREEIQKLQRRSGTGAEICLEAGEVSKVVRNAALRYSADLVIVGRGRIHEALGRLQTHSYAIIRESPCPVLSIAPDWPFTCEQFGDHADSRVCPVRL